MDSLSYCSIKKGETKMTLYTSPTCPTCRVVKMKFDKAGIQYDVVDDVAAVAALGFKGVPCLKLDDGTLLDQVKTMQYVRGLGVNKQ